MGRSGGTSNLKVRVKLKVSVTLRVRDSFLQDAITGRPCVRVRVRVRNHRDASRAYGHGIVRSCVVRLGLGIGMPCLPLRLLETGIADLRCKIKAVATLNFMVEKIFTQDVDNKLGLG